MTSCCAGGIRSAAGFPIAAQLDEQPLAVDERVGVVGFLDLDQFRLAAQIQFARPKRDRAADEVPFEADGQVAVGPDAHVFLPAFEDERRCGQRSAARPLLDDAGIPRVGQGVGTEVRRDEQAVRPAPRNATLRLRQRKSPSTNAFWRTSNSRMTDASAPPRNNDSKTRS